MFELAASEFHRGTLHIEVEKPVTGFRKWSNDLGPVRARIVSIMVLAFAFFLSVNQNPSRFMIESGYAESFEAAWIIQMRVSYALVALGIILHVVMGFWKREFMVLDFDKAKSQMRFYHQRAFNYSRPAEGMVPFSEIRAFKVVKEKVTKNSVGYVEIDLPATLGAQYTKISVALLSDEQMKFYPLNLYRITGKRPQGDWTDPDDELMGTDPVDAAAPADKT